MNNIPYVLLVDSHSNEQEILDMVNKNWDMRVFVKMAKTTAEALEILKKSEESDENSHPFLILYNEGNPRKEDIEAIKAIKDVPIVVTGESKDDVELEMLSMGVADYIPRAYDSKICAVRIRNVLQRWSQSLTDSIDRKKIVGDLAIFYDQQKVTVKGRPIKITSLEFRILAMLMQNTGKIYSRTDLIKDAWNQNVTIIKRSVDVHINRIRLKLGPVAGYIETIHGCGYRLSVAKK